MWIHANEVLNNAVVRIVNAAADFLPGLLALLIILFFTFLVAFVVRAILRRSLEGMRFDARLSEWGLQALADWEPARKPSALIAQLVFGIILALGLLVGIGALDPSLTSMLFLRVVDYLPKMAAAALVLIAGFVAARFLARSVLISAVNMQIQSARLLSLGVKWLVLVLTVAMALEHLSIGGGIVQLAFGILFGGIVLALALAVGLGSKELVSRSLEREKTTAETEEPFRHL